ncbi:MAG: hypothetical protein JWQ35_1412 [Bacteriovoracaceae bacterium]|nr:hypothetical protein [Bacteriovoracaceae bacterium]
MFLNSAWVFAEELSIDLESIESVETPSDPNLLAPADKEFLKAVRYISRDTRSISTNLPYTPYRAMPAYITAKNGDRIIPIGLRPKHEGFVHEIVGVNMRDKSVIHFAKGAPPTSIATSTFCGYKDAGQDTSEKGIAGEAQVTIKDAHQQVVWNFLVKRPSASAGPNGSGIDIQNIFYRGKLVAAEMHVPILNVKYDGDACGPYRDWQYQEGMFKADGDDAAPGIRFTKTRPQTIMESGSDEGNFRGVAIYTEGSETTVVSQMQAGWYRYASRFRFYTDGTIIPDFGFSSVENSCVCKVHHHHAYWRLDMGIDEANNNSVEVFDGQNWNPITKEVKQFRNKDHRLWKIFNPTTKRAYILEPGKMDEPALDDPYAKGDVWVLHHSSGEIDDGMSNGSTEAGLDNYVNDESVSATHVVLWYGAHFTHDSGHEGEIHSHYIGPTLRPAQ